MKRRAIKQARKIVWWVRKPPGYVARRSAAAFVLTCLRRGMDCHTDRYAGADPETVIGA